MEDHNNNNASLTRLLLHKQPIKIYHQNIRSLRYKMNELLCNFSHDPPHILYISEHHLYHEELASFHIENYVLGSCYCRTSKHKGGVCIFLHNSRKFTSLDIDNFCLDQDFEACAICLNYKHDKLCILATYRSPRGNCNTFLTKFDLTLHKFYNYYFNCIICGDINVDYLTESAKKTQLDKILQSYNLSSIVNFTTQISLHSFSTIDNFFIDNSYLNKYNIIFFLLLLFSRLHDVSTSSCAHLTIILSSSSMCLCHSILLPLIPFPPSVL